MLFRSTLNYTGNPVGIIELENGEIKIIPNPVKDVLTLVGLNNSSQIIRTEIFDTAGNRLILNTAYSDGAIDVRSLKTGEYLLSVYLDNLDKPIILKFLKE